MKSQEIANYIMSAIDKYKNGDITKENFYEIIETSQKLFIVNKSNVEPAF